MKLDKVKASPMTVGMVNGKLFIPETQLLFKNFGGEKKEYNEAGNRQFSVLLSMGDDIASLIDYGWNVKPLRSEDGEPPMYYLTVSVSYKTRPPSAWLVKTAGKLPLNEMMINMLDYVPILFADVVINPYHWDVNGKTGVKAYLDTIYVIIDEHMFDIKYAALPIIHMGDVPAELPEPDPLQLGTGGLLIVQDD